MNPKRALVLLAKGFGEIETIAPIDLLRRAGLDCITASCEEELLVDGRSGVELKADVPLVSVEQGLFDALIIPGGPAVDRLRQDERVLGMVRRHHAAGRLIGAICVGPLVLKDADILSAGMRLTGHYSIIDELPEIQGEVAVMREGNIITSRGAGTALCFAIQLVEALLSKQQSHAVAATIHLRDAWPSDTDPCSC